MIAEDPRCSEENPMFRYVDHPGAGRFLTAASSIDFSGTPRVAPGAAPQLGQHTAEVLRELLNVDEARLAALASAGIVGQSTNASSD
jgi:2-methylfumaryl-CoA isomerase